MTSTKNNTQEKEKNDVKVVKRVGSFLVTISGGEKGKTLCLSSKGEKQEGALTNYKALPTDKLSQCSVINLLYKQKKSISEVASYLVEAHLFPNSKSYEKYANEKLIEVLPENKGFKILDKEKLVLLAKVRVNTHIQASKHRGVNLTA